MATHDIWYCHRLQIRATHCSAAIRGWRRLGRRLGGRRRCSGRRWVLRERQGHRRRVDRRAQDRLEPTVRVLEDNLDGAHVNWLLVRVPVGQQADRCVRIGLCEQVGVEHRRGVHVLDVGAHSAADSRRKRVPAARPHLDDALTLVGAWVVAARTLLLVREAVKSLAAQAASQRHVSGQRDRLGPLPSTNPPAGFRPEEVRPAVRRGRKLEVGAARLDLACLF